MEQGTYNEQRAQFERDGFYIFKDLLEAPLIERLTDLSEAVLAQQDPAHFEQQRSTGSMVLIDWQMAYEYDAMAELVAHPKVLEALAQLDFAAPKFGHGRIISKGPHSPPLFWHEDGRFWDDPVSYTTQPIQCFLMYYLTDTTPQNGCLRVIPGSHLKRHRLHDEISPRHTPALTAYENPSDPGFSSTGDEIDVPLEAGDMVMGYGTLLHASHANQTDQRRTVLTMWYYPDFVDLPERTQASVALAEGRNGTASAPAEAQDLLAPLHISYDGEAAPIEQEWIPKGLQ